MALIVVTGSSVRPNPNLGILSPDRIASAMPSNKEIASPTSNCSAHTLLSDNKVADSGLKSERPVTAYSLSSKPMFQVGSALVSMATSRRSAERDASERTMHESNLKAGLR